MCNKVSQGRADLSTLKQNHVCPLQEKISTGLCDGRSAACNTSIGENNMLNSLNSFSNNLKQDIQSIKGLLLSP